jgi:hypothetical protein
MEHTITEGDTAELENFYSELCQAWNHKNSEYSLNYL